MKRMVLYILAAITGSVLAFVGLVYFTIRNTHLI